MSEKDAGDKGKLVTEPTSLPKDLLNLSDRSTLDLTGLTKEQKGEIALKANEAKIELATKAQQASVDIQALDANLTNFNSAAREASKDGTSITITHTETTSTGRTEVVMGNTERAASGKISRSGQGLQDNSGKLIFVIGAVLAIVGLAAVWGG